MTTRVLLLALQLALAFSIRGEHAALLFVAAVASVAAIDPRPLRMLAQRRLLTLVAAMVLIPALLVGPREASVAGVRFTPEYVRIGTLMAARSLAILLALRLFISRVSMRDIEARLRHGRFRTFGAACALAMDLLPRLRAAAGTAYAEYRATMPRARRVRHTLDWTAELVARVLVSANDRSCRGTQS